jgi:hypothetical protein
MNHSLKREILITSISLLILVSLTNVHANENGVSVPKPSVGILSEEVVRAQLSSLGYGKIQNFQRKGEHYVVETVQNGHSVRLKVDSATGQISEEDAGR